MFSASLSSVKCSLYETETYFTSIFLERREISRTELLNIYF